MLFYPQGIWLYRPFAILLPSSFVPWLIHPLDLARLPSTMHVGQLPLVHMLNYVVLLRR